MWSQYPLLGGGGTAPRRPSSRWGTAGGVAVRSSSPMVRQEVLIPRPTNIYSGSTRRPSSDSKKNINFEENVRILFSVLAQRIIKFWFHIVISMFYNIFIKLTLVLLNFAFPIIISLWIFLDYANEHSIFWVSQYFCFMNFFKSILDLRNFNILTVMFNTSLVMFMNYRIFHLFPKSMRVFLLYFFGILNFKFQKQQNIR